MANLRDFIQSMSNSAASNVSAPVDGINWLLGKAGLPVSSAPFMGSDWMEQKGFTRPVEQNAASLAGETAGMIAPMLAAAKAPQIARGLLQMGDNAMAPRTLNPQAGKVFVYPQDKALATAQRNAAKPVSEGGLGLHPNNTPMERAQAMGYLDDAYHGTNKDFEAFNVNSGAGKTHGAGTFFTDNPHVASTYSGGVDGGVVMPAKLNTGNPVVVDAKGANWNWLGKSTKVTAPKATVIDAEGDALMADLFGKAESSLITKKPFSKTLGKLWPDEFRFSDAASTDDLARWANKEGYDSMVFDQVKDRGPTGIFANAESALPSKNTVIFSPNQVRSRFAAFDPARRNEADILGKADPRLLGLLGAGVGGGAYIYSDK